MSPFPRVSFRGHLASTHFFDGNTFYRIFFSENIVAQKIYTFTNKCSIAVWIDAHEPIVHAIVVDKELKHELQLESKLNSNCENHEKMLRIDCR